MLFVVSVTKMNVTFSRTSIIGSGTKSTIVFNLEMVFEYCPSSESSLFYTKLINNFKLWSNSKYSTRLGEIISENRKFIYKESKKERFDSHTKLFDYLGNCILKWKGTNYQNTTELLLLRDVVIFIFFKVNYVFHVNLKSPAVNNISSIPALILWQCLTTRPSPNP